MPEKRSSKAPQAQAFKSAREARAVLDAVMKAVDRDPEVGPKLRAAAAPLRLELTDLRLWLVVAPAPRGHIDWKFSKKRPTGDPKLGLAMESAFANRLLQGRENPAIAIARGRLKPTVSDAGAALSFFGAARPLFAEYRRIVAESYPHLAVD